MPKYLMPVGNTDFKEIRETGLYYIDKTMLIDQLVGKSGAKVTLFTRPRRFGKSLNMSMLQHFFDIREKSESLFEGLAISKNKTLCDSWMNQYPTILVSFKDVDGDDYISAADQLKNIISKLYESHKYLIGDGSPLEEYEIEKFRSLLTATSSDVNLKDSLNFLTKLLYNKYNKQVILLIDEYDVPMAKGEAKGYYPKIVGVMSILLSQALKDNPYIKFAVLTGCLRIAKESIFTGLNNPKIYSILDYGFEEFFGFTDREIDRLLADTGFTEYKEKIKQWYDGYRFGDTDIYCPWDVLNYISDLQQKAGIDPKNYWANTSGNDIIKQFLRSKFNPQSDFEALLNGRCIKKTILENITYNDLISSEDNLWSVLLMTGYLTVVPEDKVDAEDVSSDNNGTYLKLVNNEIKELFSRTVVEWFKETVYKNSRDDLFKALWDGDAAELANIISRYLRTTISFYDYSESFYHAFLAGLFSGFGDINVTQKRKPGSISIKSNREYGEGRADVVIENRVTHTAAVLEFKVADNITDVYSMCDVALSQIHDIGYAEALQEDEGYDLISYGVIFYKKRCFIKKG